MRTVRRWISSLFASRESTAITAAVASLLTAILITVVYRLWVVPLIADAYDGRSFSFLNSIVALRQDHPLEDFYDAAASVLYEIVALLVAATVILLLFAVYYWILSSRPQARDRNVDLFDKVIFALGFLVSISMVLWFDNVYHSSDIETFFDWRESLSRSLKDIYVSCESCNYPLVGTLLSAGVLEGLGNLFPAMDSESVTQGFRYLLAAVDGANVVLVFLLLRALSIPRSLFWAGVIGLLPSTWVGGALWGQIDGFTQFFLLAFLLIQATFLTSQDPQDSDLEDRWQIPYVVGSSLLLAALLLTKQLAIFSVPVLVFMVLATLYLSSGKRFLQNSALFVSLLAIGVVLPDLILNLRPGYFSHLQYILIGGGSDHLNVIAGNGFNIWVFLGREMSSSSAEPIFGAITPRDAGVALFLIYEAAILWLSLVWVRQKHFDKTRANPLRDLFLQFVFLLALTNLAFNVLISGTHERYLFHFYPFIVITYLLMRHRSAETSRFILPVILAGAFFYGRFVWGILQPDAVVVPSEFLALFHLMLLGYLTAIFVRHTRSSLNSPTADVLTTGG